MSETVEIFQALKVISSQRRAANLKQGLKLLRESGIPFEEKNNGVHVIVHSQPAIDYWPSTGLWIVRGSQKRSRGILNLIAYVKRKTEP